MPKRKPTDTVSLQVRMSEALRRRIATEAERNQRSLNSEVLWRLEQTLSPTWQKFMALQERMRQEALKKADDLMNRAVTQRDIDEMHRRAKEEGDE